MPKSKVRTRTKGPKKGSRYPIRRRGYNHRNYSRPVPMVRPTVAQAKLQADNWIVHLDDKIEAYNGDIYPVGQWDYEPKSDQLFVWLGPLPKSGLPLGSVEELKDAFPMPPYHEMRLLIESPAKGVEYAAIAIPGVMQAERDRHPSRWAEPEDRSAFEGYGLGGP